MNGIIDIIQKRLALGQTVYVEYNYEDNYWNPVDALKLVPNKDGTYSRYWRNNNGWLKSDENCDPSKMNPEVHTSIFENEEEAIKFCEKHKKKG